MTKHEKDERSVESDAQSGTAELTRVEDVIAVIERFIDENTIAKFEKEISAELQEAHRVLKRARQKLLSKDRK